MRTVTCVTVPSSSSNRSTSSKPNARTSQPAASAQSSYDSIGTTSGIGIPWSDRLRERPLVALRIGAPVAAVAERQVNELLDDRRAGVPRALEVGVDVVDEDVDDRGATDVGRVPEAARRLAEVHAAAARADVELRVEPSGGARRAVQLAEPERAREELDRRLAVLVQQIRSDGLCHARKATTAPVGRVGG